MLLTIRDLLEQHRLALLDTREFSEPRSVLLDDVPFRLADLEINQWGLANEKNIGCFLDNPAKRMIRFGRFI